MLVALCARAKVGRFNVLLSEPQSGYHVVCPPDVTETQSLDSIIQKLASQGCKGAEPGVLIQCRGQTQQDALQTIAQLRITQGCTISLARPGNTARYLPRLFPFL